MKMSDIKTMSDEEVRGAELNVRQAMFEARMARATGELADTMRLLMYHDVYGEPDKARELFQRLPAEARALAGVDFAGANAACPHGVDIARHMTRALTVLA